MSSALYSWPRLFLTLIWLLVPLTPIVDFDRTTLLSLISPLPLPSPVLLCLLLLWSPLEISFQSHNHLFPLLVESCNKNFSLQDGGLVKATGIEGEQCN